MTVLLSSAGLFAPRPAEAFVTTVIGDVVTAGKWIWEQIKDASTFAWEHGAAIAYRNAVITLTTDIANDVATQITSGGIGQKPLFQTLDWGKYLEKTADNTIGDLIDEYARENSFVRYGLCEPIGPIQGISKTKEEVKRDIAKSLLQFGKNYKPRNRICDLDDLKKNWNTIKNAPDVLTKAQAFLDPAQTDLGTSLELQKIALERQAADQKIEELKLLANRGQKDIVEPISQAIKTPSVFLESQVSSAIGGAVQSKLQPTGDLVADAAGVFTQTLASRLIKRLFQQGLVPNPSGLGPSANFGLFGTSGVEYAVQVNSSISTPQLVVDQPFDIIGQLSNCPQDIKFAGVYNCTIDSRMEQLLRKADEGKLLTVKEAIQAGSLNGGWVFKNIRPSNQRSPDAWYLTDIKKLRQARIVSVGWELAADKFKDQQVTLQQVVNGFNDVASPYYHLIDPDWVLRAPQSQCRIQGPGQTLEPRGANRQDTCVDLEQCVAEDEDGNCQAWGYCVAEKNVWRFGGNSCEFPEGSGYSPYATCQTFSSPAGSTFSVLTNSLQNYDDPVCSQAVGCKWYSKEFNPTSQGADRYSSNTADRIYLKNLDKAGCSSSDEGCTEFLRISSIDIDAVSGAVGNNPAEQLVNKVLSETDTNYVNYATVKSEYLKEAPDYLHCYDVDDFGRPITDNDSAECKKFLSWCSADELGCDNYKPADGSPSVPAVIQAGDSCPKECVGINSYVKAASFFDRDSENMEFIPTTAQSCPAQYAGCSEFTNLEQPASGEQKEYYSQLQQCIKDTDTRAKTYYTWVGSDLTGFQLKTWRLQSSNAADLSAPPETPGGSTCDPLITPDCKQFYSINGSISYRLASEVITASASCARYRATSVPITQCDPSINGGSWDGALNACIFNAIPNEGKKCEAKYNGCREFRGPTATNIKLVFPISTFGDQDSGSTFTIDPTSTGNWTGGTNSNESLVAFGHSYDSGNDGLIARELKNQNITLTVGKTYLLSFWAKKFESVNNVGVAVSPTYTVQVNDPINFDWAEYKVSVSVTAGNNYDVLGLRFNASPRYVIDNIQFKEITDTFYVNKNSWKTPASCLAPSGASPYLGCAAYTNKNNTTFTVHSFSRLCRAEAAGCEALIDTKNSSKPRSETFTTDNQTVVVPADEIVYRAYDKSKQCGVQNKACQRLGEPALDQTNVPSAWGDKFVKLNPDTFATTNPASPLCGVNEDRCQVFKDTSGGSHYFKDPGSGLCEYKQVTSLEGYGWYKTGTNEPCNLQGNPSFEKVTAGGPNLLQESGFESFSTTDSTYPWKIVSGNWVKASTISTSASYTKEGLEAVGIANDSVAPKYLRQSFNTAVGELYTVRVWTNGSFGSGSTVPQRSLHLTCGGLSLWDYTNYLQDWEELAITFKATTTSCNFDLGVAYDNGLAFFDKAQVTVASEFVGWKVNDNELVPPIRRTTLIQDDSLPGKYWDSNLLKIKTNNNLYSGIRTADYIDVGVKDVARYFTVSANIFVPDIEQNKTDWWVDMHATPPAGCQTRSVTGNYECHHGDYISSDLFVTNAEKGKWVYKYGTMKVDPGVSKIAIFVLNNAGVTVSPGVVNCTAATCIDGQVAYVDQVSIFESAAPYAYSCPSDQSSCTGFRDPALTDKVYYYLNDKKIDTNSCGGKVSEKDGCLLFADLSKSTTNFRAQDTYLNSQKNNNQPQSPEVADATVGEIGDTNSVIKVTRSRVCGEWLSCQSEAIRYESGGDSTSICYSLGRCNQYGNEGSSKCGNWVNVENPQPLIVDNIPDNNTYEERDVNWSGNDLSGYSIPGIYPIDTLKQKNMGTQVTPDIKLTYIDAGGLAVGVDGKGVDNGKDVSKQCRLYPKVDSPFPSDLATFKAGGSDVEGGGNIERKIGGYTDANICQPFDAFGNPQNCECSYQQVSYELGENRFYGLFSQPDISVLTDKAQGTKSRINRQDYLIGLRGYCLEKDTSRSINGDKDNACLTWMPLDNVSGDISIYDYAPDAGFNNPSVAYYCSAQAANHKGADGYDWNLGNYSCHNLNDDDGTMVWGSIAYPSTWPAVSRSQIGGIVAHLNTWNDNQSCRGGNRSGYGIDIMSGVNNCRGFISGGNEVDGNVCSQVTSTDPYRGGDYKSTLFSRPWSSPDYNDDNDNPPICSGDGNAITMRAVFDSNDILIGFNVYACTKGNNGSASIAELYPSAGSHGLVIQLKTDYCSEISKVANGIQNKAQTNRLLNSDLNFSVDVGGGIYDKSADLSPFGAISGLVDLKNNLIPIYQYTSAVRAASPYGCATGATGFDCGASSRPNICIGGDRNRQPCSTPTDNDRTGCGDEGICLGTRFAVTGSVGITKVQQLFARVYSLYSLSSTRRGYDTVSASLSDISGDPAIGQAPKVKTVNFVNNKSTGEGVDGFTIKANDEIYNTGNRVFKSPVSVSANFYGYNTNGNQMPLAEVRVDWVGDPDNSSGSIGKYKNHKPFCQPAKLTDGTANPAYNFGDSPQACVDDSGVSVGYFSYARTLSCLPGGQGLPACPVAGNAPCWDKTAAGGAGACIYKPRVYLRDNWDWCFGGPAGTPTGKWGIDGAAAACSLYSNNAWLNFNGTIQVQP